MMSNAELRVYVVAEAVVAYPEPERCYLLPSGLQIVGVSLVVTWVLVPS